MKQIFENLKALGTKRLMMLGGVGAGVLAAIIFAAVYLVQPEYRPLSTGLSSTDSAQIFAELEGAGYQPRVSDDGSVVSVPSADLARARMTIASAGLPGSNVAGWEIFDESGGLGMTSFSQRIQRMRALEGELVRSIRTMDPVEDARVHLVLPERETFSQERPEASASVVVKTKRGLPLERKNALAVRNLVASAIPDLSPERVTILSSDGETVLGSESESAAAMSAFNRGQIEERITRNIESLITARVGSGNVKVRVAADISNEREVVVSHTFDQEQQVARRTSVSDEQTSSNDPRSNSVDVANNMPGFDNGASGGAAKTSDSTRSKSETDYEIGNVRSERVIEPGDLRRLSVAILVNGTMVNDTYQERDAAELQMIAALARSAAGIDEKRGDVVTIESMRFAEGVYEFAGEPSWMDRFLEQYAGTLIRGGLFLLSLLLAGFFILRPVMKGSR